MGFQKFVVTLYIVRFKFIILYIIISLHLVVTVGFVGNSRASCFVFTDETFHPALDILAVKADSH